MSDKKAVFFDADGTICDIEKGVPDSAIESIKIIRYIFFYGNEKEAVCQKPPLLKLFRSILYTNL